MRLGCCVQSKLLDMIIRVQRGSQYEKMYIFSGYLLFNMRTCCLFDFMWLLRFILCLCVTKDLTMNNVDMCLSYGD